MVVLTIVFGKLGQMPSGGVRYPLLVFCGLLPWQFFFNRSFREWQQSGQQFKPNFQGVFSSASRTSSERHHKLCRLSYFGGPFLFLLMIWYQFVPPAQIVLLPLSFCFRLPPHSASACGLPRSWSNTAIFGSSCRSLSSLDSTSRQSGFRAEWFRIGPGCFTRSIRWLASLTASAGRSWRGTHYVLAGLRRPPSPSS